MCIRDRHKVVCIIITGAWVLGTFVNGHLFNTVLDMYNNKYGVFVISYIVAILGIIIVCCVSRYIKVDFIGYIGKNSLIYFAWHGSIGFRIMDFICGKFGLFDKTIDAMNIVEKYCKVGAYFVFTIFLLTAINYIISKTKLKFIIGK